MWRASSRLWVAIERRDAGAGGRARRGSRTPPPRCAGRGCRWARRPAAGAAQLASARAIGHPLLLAAGELGRLVVRRASARPSSASRSRGPRWARRAATRRRSSAAGPRCRAPRTPAAGGGTGRRSRWCASRTRVRSRSPRSEQSRPSDGDPPGVRVLQQARGVQQARLARARGPDQARRSRPGSTSRSTPRSTVQRPGAGDVGALQPADGEDRLTHSEAPPPDRGARRARPAAGWPERHGERRRR